MTSIGETLRRERQKRNLQLDQVSRELKISTRFLEAIEDERFDRLPGGVFAKSFVRQYARMLNIDEEEAATEVQRTLAPPSFQQFAEAAPNPATPPTVEFAPRVDSISSRPFASGSWLPALALVVAVMLGCSLVYGWWQRDHRQASASPAPKPVQSATVQASNTPPQLPAPSPEAAAPVEEPPVQPPVTEANGISDKPAVSTPSELRPAGAVKVEITAADEPVWILARTDGKYAFSGTLEANQTRSVDANGTVVLRLGNAGGVAITVNGKHIPPVGPKGQVRTVQLTSGGFQIVAAPKPSAPGTPL